MIRFETAVTKEAPLHKAKLAVLGSGIYLDIANNNTTGLISALGRVIGSFDKVIKDLSTLRSKAILK